MAASVLVSGMYGPLRGGGSVKIQNPNRTQMAAKQAYEVSGCGPEDLDVAEVYDAMAPIELISLEDLGICKPGEAAHLLDEGFFDLGGKMPVNTSGGLMSRGHPLGATGLAQITEIVWQLRGDGGQRQVPDAKVGLCHSMGAGQTCCVTILKR